MYVRVGPSQKKPSDLVQSVSWAPDSTANEKDACFHMFHFQIHMRTSDVGCLVPGLRLRWDEEGRRRTASLLRPTTAHDDRSEIKAPSTMTLRAAASSAPAPPPPAAAAACALDPDVLNAATVGGMDDLGLQVFAKLCGANRGAFVLDPPDGRTYG